MTEVIFLLSASIMLAQHYLQPPLGQMARTSSVAPILTRLLNSSVAAVSISRSASRFTSHCFCLRHLTTNRSFSSSHQQHQSDSSSSSALLVQSTFRTNERVIHWKRFAAAAAALTTAAAITTNLISSAHADPAPSSSTSSTSSSTSLPSGRTLYTFGSGLDSIRHDLPATLTGPQKGIVQLVSGMNVAAVLTEDGEVYTIGRGSGLALGHGDTANCTQLRKVEALAGKRITHLSIHDNHGAAVETLTDGSTRVYTWGNRALGFQQPPKPRRDFGRGSLPPSNDQVRTRTFGSTPIELIDMNDKQIVQVACGKHHTLLLSQSGDVFATGSDRHGALGLGDKQTDSPVPTLIPSLQGQYIKQISAGNGCSLFLTEEGRVYVAGSNDYGQSGTGTNQRQVMVPTLIPYVNSIVRVSAGAYHNFAIDAEGRAYGFGLNSSGQLGLGHRNLEVRQPTRLPLDAKVAAVSAGLETSAIITDSGKLFMQGRGALGRADQIESSAALRDSPVEVVYFSKSKLPVAQAATGADFTLALIK